MSHPMFWSTRKLVQRLIDAQIHYDRHLAELDRAVTDLGKRLDGSSGASLRAEIDDLASALATHTKSVRRELGKLWGGKRRDAEEDDSETGDPKLDAILRAQRSGPVRPQ